MADRRKRRKWSDEEKARIIAQTRVPGVSVPEVAHRYDLNTNMIFKWIRDPRYNCVSDNEPEALSFLPVEVPQNSFPAERAHEPSAMPGSLKIVLANGHHLELTGAFDTDAVVRLARGLSE